MVQPYRMMSPNHPEYDGGKVYTVAQFVPGKRGEQVMLEGAEETAIREMSLRKRWTPGCSGAIRGRRSAQRGILEDITVSIDGSSGMRESVRQ